MVLVFLFLTDFTQYESFVWVCFKLQFALQLVVLVLLLLLRTTLVVGG